MTTKINGASAGYTSPNDLGYVGLPREAVLNDTVSPAEQRAFAMIAAIPLAIPVAFFAPEAALLASLAALTGCGSPGEAGDPILFSNDNSGQGDISPDGGTADDGDAFIATDTGPIDNGDTLIAADDVGMSGPDDGMTIADIATDLDDTLVDDAVGNDVDGLVAADDGMSMPDEGVTIADAKDAQDVDLDQSETADIKDVTVPPDSGDTLVAKDDGGMSVPDDGEAITEVVNPQDVVLDSITDQSETVGVKDVPIASDSSDVLVVADDGVSVDEVVNPLDVVPPPDAGPDQNETIVGSEVVADTATPCSPSCVPVADTVTCEDGSTNVAVNYFVKCATQFVCDGVGTSLVSINLSDPTTQTTQSITVDKCVNDILFGGCQAINGDLSEFCGSVKIVAKPKPVPPPTVTNPTLTNPFPSGDGCFKGGNSFTASWSASASNNDPLLCTATLKDVLTNKDIASVQVSQAPSNTMSADIPIANGNVLPFRDYALSVFCTDSTGQKGSATSDPILTYYKETLLLYRFKDGAGTKVTDSGPLKLDGVIIGNPQWVVGGGLYFDAKTRVSTPKPPIFKTLNEVSMLVVFKPTVPQTNQYAVLATVSSSAVIDSWGMEIVNYSYTQFIQAHNNSALTFVASPNPISSNTTYSFLGIHQSGLGTNLSEWDGSKWQTSASKQNYLGPFISDDNGDISTGCWNNGLYCYIGDVYQVAIIGKNINNCN